jgi:hypothetical protein
MGCWPTSSGFRTSRGKIAPVGAVTAAGKRPVDPTTREVVSPPLSAGVAGVRLSWRVVTSDNKAATVTRLLGGGQR